MPTGTRSPAIAPTTVPMKNGVRSEASPKNRTAERPAARAPCGVLEREPGTSQHDPERREAERDEERGEDRLEGRGESGPEHDQREDQPHVVCLPDRSDRPVDQRARPPAPVSPTREQAPDAGAEVRPAEDGVHRRDDEEDDGDGVGLAHAGVSAGPGAGPDSGP